MFRGSVSSRGLRQLGFENDLAIAEDFELSSKLGQGGRRADADLEANLRPVPQIGQQPCYRRLKHFGVESRQQEFFDQRIGSDSRLRDHARLSNAQQIAHQSTIAIGVDARKKQLSQQQIAELENPHRLLVSGLKNILDDDPPTFNVGNQVSRKVDPLGNFRQRRVALNGSQIQEDNGVIRKLHFHFDGFVRVTRIVNP